MKTKVLIVAFLIVSLLGAFTLKANAQNKPYHVITQSARSGFIPEGKDTLLIGDETWITQLKTGAKIVSYSEQAFKDISLKFGDQFKSITIKYKTDRNGPYKEYAIYLSKKVAANITNWAKINL